MVAKKTLKTQIMALSDEELREMKAMIDARLSDPFFDHFAESYQYQRILERLCGEYSNHNLSKLVPWRHMKDNQRKAFVTAWKYACDFCSSTFGIPEADLFSTIHDVVVFGPTIKNEGASTASVIVSLENIERAVASAFPGYSPGAYSFLGKVISATK